MNASYDAPIEYRIQYFSQSVEDKRAAAQPPAAEPKKTDAAAGVKTDNNSFQTREAAFSGSVARSFGIGDRDQAKNPYTWYSVNTPKPEEISFEVSNNSLGASILRNGAVRAAAVLTRVGPASYKENGLRGDFAHREMICSGPWRVKIRGAELPDTASAGGPGPRVDLLDGLFPLFRWQQGHAAVELLYFAPVDPQTLSQEPRALIAVLKVTNTGTAPVKGSIEIEGTAELSGPLPAEAHSAFLSLDGSASSVAGVPFELPAGASLVRPFTFVVGANAAELKQTAARVCGQNALAWLNQTRGWRLRQLGQLTIPDAPHLAEMLVRYEEMCRQSVFYQPDGAFGAGGLGRPVRAGPPRRPGLLHTARPERLAEGHLLPDARHEPMAAEALCGLHPLFPPLWNAAKSLRARNAAVPGSEALDALAQQRSDPVRPRGRILPSHGG